MTQNIQNGLLEQSYSQLEHMELKTNYNFIKISTKQASLRLLILKILTAVPMIPIEIKSLRYHDLSVYRYANIIAKLINKLKISQVLKQKKSFNFNHDPLFDKQKI